MNGLPFFPQSASSIAPQVDHVFFAMLAICSTVALGIFIAMTYFLIKYRAGSNADRGHRASLARRHGIEYVWTLLPIFIFIGIFIWAARVYVHEYTPPKTGEEVYVVAKQWMWKLQHPDGRREINELHVPVNENVRLIMTSQDVIHSFYVPAFRIKHDVLPDRFVDLWFRATRVGNYRLACAEYCGMHHADMVGRIIVMPKAAYARWLSEGPARTPLARQGAALFRAKGCSGCHGATSQVHAPKLEGVFGHVVALQGGTFVRADETYIRDSILLPRKDIVVGYEPIMPSFSGQLSESQILALVAYIKSLANQEPPQ